MWTRPAAASRAWACGLGGADGPKPPSGSSADPPPAGDIRGAVPEPVLHQTAAPTAHARSAAPVAARCSLRRAKRTPFSRQKECKRRQARSLSTCPGAAAALVLGCTCPDGGRGGLRRWRRQEGGGR